MIAKAVYHRPIKGRSLLFDNLIVRVRADRVVLVTLVQPSFLNKPPSISPGTFMTKP